MTQMAVADGEEGSDGRTVVVGVKMDLQSRELLTWALVKVARAGDRVIAIHVVNNNDILDRDGKSSILLSVVKSFDSILAVYEGFCNLKQVDLKLKICRGSSAGKILVDEAKSYSATQVIVGTAQSNHKLRSTASVAKYCAKKLSKDCSVLAVNNGKVVFQRESNSSRHVTANETEHHDPNGLLNAPQRLFSKNSRVLTDGRHSLETKLRTWDEDSRGKTDRLKRDCSICSLNSVAPNDSGAYLAKDSSTNGSDENLMTTAPLKLLDAAPNLISLFKESPELKPGWPLLRPTVLSSRKPQYSSHVKQISVVEWAMQLPSRYCSSIENLTRSDSEHDGEKDQSCELDGESGAMVSVGNVTVSVPLSPDCISNSLLDELERIHQTYSATCRLFKFHELASVTSNFSPDNMIGKGGSSQVYKGCLPDGKELAIKILKQSDDSLKEFVLEIEIITALHHKNIMSLFGFCFEDHNLLLVYDFLSRGSLEENLYGAEKEPSVFGWRERFKVAIGVAEALDYLHNREPQPVIHGDIKSSNVLLSDDFEPQLSDFGLAKWASPTSSHITCTDVAGTFGYLAPEYFMYGKVNEKIDVYAYGVVLLELLSGRKPISSNCPKGQESLVMWAKPFLNHGKFACLLDLNFGDRYDCEEAERMVLAASLCIRRAPRARPQMSFVSYFTQETDLDIYSLKRQCHSALQVLKLLQGDKEATKWARLQVHASEGSTLEGSDILDDDAFSRSNIRSHLNLALLGVEEDSVSGSSIEQSVSLEDYLRGRWSRSSSLD